MKTKHYLSAAVLALAFTACGDDYDDTALWNQVNDNTNRIEALETWQEQVNNNIAALQQLLNTTDYITSVTPVTKDGKEVGYTISFRNSDPITIYHGEKGDQGEQGEQGEQGIPGEPGKDGADGSDGSDGSTPQIGAEADGGTYYWTVNGEWLLDSEGKKIPLTGEDGKDAIAPQIRINETTNEWEISTDGGNTWTSTHVAATGEDGDTLIESIETAADGNSVTITLTGSDTPIVLPTWQWAESIEEEITELNGQLEAYAGLMQGKFLITAVEATKDGQKITYITVDEDGKPSAPQSFTITNGKDGEKGESGATPTVEIGDNGNWIINDTDTGVPATGENGKDGKTPTFKIENGYLYYQFNGDSDWKELGKVEGPQGDKGEQGIQGNPGNDGVFTGITYTQGDAKAVLTLADGKIIEVAIYQPLTIGEGTGTLTVPANGTTDITLTIPDNVTALMAQITPEGSGGTFTDLDTRAVSGWSVEAKLDEQKVTVTAPASGKALLDVSLIRADGSKVTASRVLQAATTVTAENCTNINGTGDYVVKGSFGSSITVTGGSPTIYLDGATVSVGSGNAINITGGNPTIYVVGENNNISTSKGAGIYVAEGSTVTITGSSRDDELIVRGGNGRPGIGGCIADNDYEGVSCGNINISNITVSAYGSTINNLGFHEAPGIGSVGYATCGTITISSATVHAFGIESYPYSTPGIGCGYTSAESPKSIPDVIASNSEIHAHRGDPGGTCDYIGWAADLDDPSSTYANSAIAPGAGGSIKSSTVYCYTGENLDKTVVYDASGTGEEQ